MQNNDQTLFSGIVRKLNICCLFNVMLQLFYYSCCSQLNVINCMVFVNYSSLRRQYNSCRGQGHIIVRLFVSTELGVSLNQITDYS